MTGEHIEMIEIFLQGEGIAEVEAINLPSGSKIKDIAISISKNNGFVAEEILIFEEDRDEPCAPDADLSGSHSGVHHAHRVRKLEVKVFYLGKEIKHHFSPAARVQKVLDWAVKTFAVDPVIAPEMQLTLHSQTTALPKEAHIGRYVKFPQHEIEFDLIRGVIPNGSGIADE